MSCIEAFECYVTMKIVWAMKTNKQTRTTKPTNQHLTDLQSQEQVKMLFSCFTREKYQGTSGRLKNSVHRGFCLVAVNDGLEEWSGVKRTGRWE